MMDAITAIIVVALLHCVLFFFDALFKSCSHVPYLYFLHNTGLQIEAFRIRWFTTTFNRFLQKCGTWRPRLLDCWFTVGTSFSLALLPVAFFIIIKTAIDVWQKGTSSHGTREGLVLEPMVPGINFPMNDLSYYIITLTMCMIVHEFGHAVAAVREDVHISGVGLMVLLILPVAYVQLNTEQFEFLPAKKQLRISCAGVWHNVVLTCGALLLLNVLPILIYPFFEIGNGVIVQHIQEMSPVLGASGLSPGDKITAINQCQVKSYETWYHCILTAVNNPSPGYCVSSEVVREHDESVPVRHLPGGGIECCSVNSPDHLCFEYVEKEESMPELPQHSCLPGRVMIESAQHMCTTASDCVLDLHCLVPSLENHTRLLRIQRAQEKVVIFLGHPGEVYSTVQVSDFAPQTRLSADIPESVVKLCKYVCMFSIGLAVVNIIPCFYMDGQLIIRALTNAFLAGKIEPKNVRDALAMCITIIGTVFVTGMVFSMVLSIVL